MIPIISFHYIFRMKVIKIKILDWIEKYKDSFSETEHKYMIFYIKNNKDPFPSLYLLMKVPKSNLTTRPIISCSGSLLQSVGIWLNCQLQTIAIVQQAYLKSSWAFLKRTIVQKVPKERFFKLILHWQNSSFPWVWCFIQNIVLKEERINFCIILHKFNNTCNTDSFHDCNFWIKYVPITQQNAWYTFLPSNIFWGDSTSFQKWHINISMK